MYTKIEQPGASSTIALNDTYTNINEMLPERNSIVASSSPKDKTKRNKIAIAKPVNQGNGSPLISHISRNQSDTPQNDAHTSNENHPGSQKNSVHTFFAKLKKTPKTPNRLFSIADKKLKDIIHDLDENPVEDDAFAEHTTTTGCSKRIRLSRKVIQHIMEQPNFHYVIIVLIMLDLIIVFVDLVVGKLLYTDQFLEIYIYIYMIFINSFSCSK